VQPALALAHAGKTQRRMVSAATGTVFVQDSADAARTQWRPVADQLRGKLGMLMDGAENVMQGGREECLDAGMDDYVTKPNRVHALVQPLLSVPAQSQ
jgi:CheY-like chemotaxis protein